MGQQRAQPIHIVVDSFILCGYVTDRFRPIDAFQVVVIQVHAEDVANVADLFLQGTFRPHGGHFLVLELFIQTDRQRRNRNEDITDTHAVLIVPGQFFAHIRSRRIDGSVRNAVIYRRYKG